MEEEYARNAVREFVEKNRKILDVEISKMFSIECKKLKELEAQLKMKENEILSLKADLEMANDKIKFLEENKGMT